MAFKIFNYMYQSALHGTHLSDQKIGASLSNFGGFFNKNDILKATKIPRNFKKTPKLRN